MIPKYLLRMTIALIATSLYQCRSDHQHWANLSALTGEDPSMALLPGQGFNHLNWTAKGHCVDLGPFSTQSGQETGQLVEFELLEIKSLSELRKKLNITAAASFRSSLFGQISGRFDFAKAVNKRVRTRYLLVHTRVANQTELASSFRFTKSAQELLKLDKIQEFTKHCGTKFVYGRRTGGEFFALFNFEFSNAEEDRRFSAALKGARLGWSMSTSLNDQLSRFDMNAKTEFSLYRLGSRGPVPQVDNLEDFARHFAELVTTETSDSITLELITKDYAGVEPMNLAPNPGYLLRQDQVINALAKNRDRATELLNSLTHIRNHPAFYERFDDQELDQAEFELLDYINLVNQKAIDCFENIHNNCSLPTIPFPRFRLPRKNEIKRQTPNCEGFAVWRDELQACCERRVDVECLAKNNAKACILTQISNEEVVCQP